MSVNVSLARMSADLFVNGHWVEGQAGNLNNVDPGNGATLGTVSLATADQVDEAIQAADAAFPSWSTMLPSQRAAIMVRAADQLASRTEEAVATMLLETGKTEADARGEITRAVWNLRWHGEEAARIRATVYPGLAPGSRRLSIPTPLGPVALISAWNFPAVLTTRKLGPALAAGCTTVLKASEFAPATARLIVEALADAGLPDGVVNLIFGDPQQVSEQLIASASIKALSFTGSTAVGKLLAEQAASRLLPTIMELGGHAPVVVMEDADVDVVVNTISAGKFASAGQSCASPSRFFIHQTLYDEFVAKLTVKAESLVLGHGSSDGVTLGAVAHQGRIDALVRLTEDAQAKGAKITTGGKQAQRHGFYFEPTIVADLPLNSDAQILREEPFGPIATVSSFSSREEAIEAANSAPYAYAAYIFTASKQHTDTLASRLNATNIGVNQLAFAMPDVPMSGLGNSGYGYEGGLEGILAFTQLRLVSETVPQ